MCTVLEYTTTQAKVRLVYHNALLYHTCRAHKLKIPLGITVISVSIPTGSDVVVAVVVVVVADFVAVAVAGH